MLPNAAQWQHFYTNVMRKSGLDLSLYKANQLHRRILGMVEAKKLANLEEFWNYIDASAANMTEFMDRLAINVSELFRNPERWKDLEDKVFPDLLSRTKNLKIWSAGCSYGAEAHTLAVILDAKFPGNHQIFGSDIDQAALNQAKSGTFNVADMKCMPPQYLDRYFTKLDEKFVAKPVLSKYLSFKTGNLLSDRFDTDYDLICCRNVVIYFTDDAKDALYRKFYQALKPGGLLFVGSTERIFNTAEMGFETQIPFFYQKPIHGEQKWRNAS